MKKLLFTAVAMGLSVLSQAQQFEPKDAGSSVVFKIKNFGLMVDGTFTGLNGKIIFNPNDLNTSLFDVTLNTNTISTGIDLRDNHLRKPDYFDTQNYPGIRFTSTKIENTKTPGKYLVTGNLTIKQKTKEIKFPFTALPQAGNYLFTGGFQINRRDFKVGGGSISLADELTIDLKVFAKAVKI